MPARARSAALFAARTPDRAPPAGSPPGLKRPALLQLIAYVTRPFEHFSEQRARFGDVFSTRLPGLGEQVVVGSPEGIQALVTGSYEAFDREAETVRYLVGGHALVFQQGVRHRQLRTAMTPPFHGDRMRAYGPAMLRVTDQVLGAREPGASGPIQPEMLEITVRVILQCVFGVSEGPRFDRLERLLVEYVDGMLTPWAFVGSLLLSGTGLLNLLERLGQAQRAASPEAAPPLSRLPLLRQADRLGAIDAILFDEIARCEQDTGDRQDILAMLIRAGREQGAPLDRQQLRDQLIMLMIAGHETTSNSLCWALYHLAKHPDAVARLRSEHEQLFGDELDPLRARELSYLGAVIQESMRLSPIAVGVARRLKQDLTLGPYTLRAGSVVIPSSYLAQHDPRVWPEPERFDPSRFLGKKPVQAAHFPFGAGVWRCLGAAFAEYEMRVVLARLLMRYDIELTSAEPPRPMLKGITITPRDGLPMRLRARAPRGQIEA
jgi:cytochrome P450 family 110